jgi:hypothetical protein
MLNLLNNILIVENFKVQMRNRVLYVLMICFLPYICSAQETSSCAEKLKNAQTLFEKGQVEQVPSMLSLCLKSGFTREESLLAYKLIIQAYLFEDKQETADSVMFAFLKANPEYKISSTDHPSFVHLYNFFRVKPVVQISIHAGTNIPFLTNIKSGYVGEGNSNDTYSTQALNVFGSVEAKFEIFKNLELNIEPGFSQLSFIKTSIFNRYEKNGYTETQSRIELPVTATYSFKNFGKFTPFGRLGLGPAFLLSANASTVRTPLDANLPPSTPVSDLKMKDSRIPVDLFLQAGAGVEFKVRGGSFNLELRSNFGMLNQKKVGGENIQELETNRHIADNQRFNMNALNFNFGYTQIFYKPLKRRE